MEKHYIGIDCGTQSIKTVIYREDTTCVAEHAIPTEIEYPQPQWAQMDADHYLGAVREGIRVCLKKSGIDPASVRAICGDGIICGVVGVNKEGVAITPYIPYLDTRAAEDAKWVNENCEPYWIEESGNNVLEAFYPPIFSRWIVKNDEAFKKDGAKIMNIGPYTLSRLAGLGAEDAFIDWATLSGWLAGYDAIEKKWSKRQMDELEIPMEYLPKIVESTDIIGHLCEEEAKNTGLPAGVPIVAGAGDTMQSNLGCGLVEAGMAADVAGTASMFTIMVDGINENLTRNTDMLFSIGTLPDTYFYWGYIRTGGLSLRWFRDNVCGKMGDQDYYDYLSEQAEKVPAGAGGVLFFPYLTGGAGNVVKEASGCFVNMNSNTAQPHMWRAVLESIAYEYRSLTDILRDSGIPVERVIITEGGSRSKLWNQIKADVLDAKVSTLKRLEGALMANIACAAYAVGDIPDLKEAITKWIAVKDQYEPDKANTAYYRKAYAIQQTLLKEKMPDAFREMAQLQSQE